MLLIKQLCFCCFFHLFLYILKVVFRDPKIQKDSDYCISYEGLVSNYVKESKARYNEYKLFVIFCLKHFFFFFKCKVKSNIK